MNKSARYDPRPLVRLYDYIRPLDPATLVQVQEVSNEWSSKVYLDPMILESGRIYWRAPCLGLHVLEGLGVGIGWIDSPHRVEVSPPLDIEAVSNQSGSLGSSTLDCCDRVDSGCIRVTFRFVTTGWRSSTYSRMNAKTPALGFPGLPPSSASWGNSFEYFCLRLRWEKRWSKPNVLSGLISIELNPLSDESRPFRRYPRTKKNKYQATTKKQHKHSVQKYWQTTKCGEASHHGSKQALVLL